VTIFDFGDYRDYLKHRIAVPMGEAATRKGRKTAKPSLTRVAQRLGYPSSSLLSMILSGKRLPSDEFCESIANHWKLSAKESEYLRLLVQLERKRRNGQDLSQTYKNIARLARGRSAYVLNESEFASMYQWYYLVIKEMVTMPGFVEDAEVISKKLRRKATASQIRDALDVLLKLGVLERDPETGKLRHANNLSETKNDVPSSAIRMHHRQMMHRALEALDEQSLEARTFSSVTLSVDQARLPELRAQIWDFIRHINAEFSSSNSTSVYQLNAQFFEHTFDAKSFTKGGPQ
jgi:uncharacterized protein (TIGR02147 family)